MSSGRVSTEFVGALLGRDHHRPTHPERVAGLREADRGVGGIPFADARLVTTSSHRTLSPAGHDHVHRIPFWRE